MPRRPTDPNPPHSSHPSDPDRGDERPATAPPVGALDRLRAIYRSPGPFTSVYMGVAPPIEGAADPISSRWRKLSAELAAQIAPTAAVEAIRSRLDHPTPTEAAAVGIIAGADGTTIVDHGSEPPRRDMGIVDSLPYVNPLLVWEQARIPNLVVSVDARSPDAAVFRTDQRTIEITSSRSIARLAGDIGAQAQRIGCPLILLLGDHRGSHELGRSLVRAVPDWCRIAVTDESRWADEPSAGEFGEAPDATAGRTVARVHEVRYRSGGEPRTLLDTTIEALNSGRPDVLLIQDHPGDHRRVWIGSHPQRLSAIRTADFPTRARLVDAAIRGAVSQGMEVHVMPATGTAETGVEAVGRSREAMAPEPGRTRIP